MLDKFISWGLTALVFVIPLFFLPITSEFYEFNKNALLLVACGLLLLAWVGKMVVNQKVVFRRTAFDLPVLAIALAFVASTVLASVNKWEALWTPGATGTIIGLTVLYFLITNNLTPSAIRHLPYALVASASILAFIAIFQFVGLDRRFTPAGNPIALATFLAVSLVFTIGKIYAQAKSNKQDLFWYLNLLASLIIAIGLGLTGYQLLTAIKPVLLSYSTSWAIAIETFKNQPVFGVGPNSFLEAFTRFRPLAFNGTLFWASRFGASSSWYLHLMTTVGLAGLISFLWLAIKVVRSATNPLAAGPIFLIFVALVFLPANFLILFTLWVFLAIYALDLPTREYAEESRILGGIFLVAVLSLLGVGLWLGGKAYAGEFFFFQSLKSLAQNKGTDTYNLQIKAINMNPQADFYRLAYSQTNLALANSIASPPTGGPTGGLTDQDRQNISQLVQQAINEAKTAVALNPRRINNWENLAQIYRSLINFAQGADQWTVASYQQAINLDPLNPNLRINLGGVYYALGNYDQAINLFQQSVNLKPDFANGHYNLAAALREKREYAQALGQMEVVLALVDPNSGDWQKAKDELEKLKEKVKEIQPKVEKKPETLIPPSPIPSPVIEPPLQLPEESSPPTNP